ncbi:unnamed protein product [Camellia sinensis]
MLFITHSFLCLKQNNNKMSQKVSRHQRRASLCSFVLPDNLSAPPPDNLAVAPPPNECRATLSPPPPPPLQAQPLAEVSAEGSKGMEDKKSSKSAI